MLRNSAKKPLCGLAILLITGCSNVSPLIDNGDTETNNYCKLSNIKINSDPYYEYKIKSSISKILSPYKKKLSRYKIKIDIKEESGTEAYTEKEVVKEQKRIIAHIKISDSKHNEIFSNKVDSFASYEVNDSAPFASISSEKQATDSMLIDLSNNISMVILSFLKNK